MRITRQSKRPAGERPASGSRPPTLRSAFTLVELMVVITIIAILATILGVVLGNMGQQAKEAATMATIKKIHAQLEQRLEAFDRQIGQIEESGRQPNYYLAAERRFPSLSDQPTRILVRKQLMKDRFFPQRYDDLDTSDPTLLDLKNRGQQSGEVALRAESSELLYYMLTHMPVGESPTVDAGEFLASEVADTDGDGLMEFVDGWGKPLRFYRWPTRLFRSNGTDHTDADHDTASLLIQGLPDHSQEAMIVSDPDDPLGLLDPLITYLNSHPPTFEERFHTPNTYFVPLIVSAGPDETLGLGEPYEYDPNGNDADIMDFGYLAQPDSANLGALTDNITNRNQRAGN